MPVAPPAAPASAMPRLLHLPADPEAAATARRFVADCLACWELPDRLPEAALVVDELVTNAVRHAQTPVTLSVARRPDRLVVQVEDHSPDLPAPSTDDPSLDDAGRGLRVVDSLTVSWGVLPVDDGKRVWAELEL